MSSSQAKRSPTDSKTGSSIRTGDDQLPSLLPSAFPNEGPISPHTEGYEGEKLHEMFLSARSLRPDNTEVQVGDGQTGDIAAQSDVQTNDNVHFEPFFTVIEDSVTGTQHHPYVHYIFSDDDTDLMTSAIFSALDHKDERVRNQSVEGLANPSYHGGRERCIVVDVDHSGESIVSAQSLVPEWQVLDYSITTAPTFGESSNRQDAGLMLRIEGQDGNETQILDDDPGRSALNKNMTNDELVESLDRLANQFNGELATLKKLASSNISVSVSDTAEDT